ncbi:MAG TPA: adenylate/guanylate cyclase domain-containing protein [Stellaceae bacterium]|nr:adenylate/guanylate cyclase domain-containing protein [Stellaceae bacterium]
MPPAATARGEERLHVAEGGAERFVAILFVDIRASTQLVETRLPYDVVFILNRFFEAVGSAITVAGGTPNQFIGDGMMAIFGTKTRPGKRVATADRLRHRHSCRRGIPNSYATSHERLADDCGLNTACQA